MVILVHESLDQETKSEIINEIGIFTYGKTNWLEYHYLLETCLEEHHIYSDLEKKDILLGAIGARTLKTLKSVIRPLSIQDIDYETIVAKLEAHFYPNPNKQYYTTKFSLRKQKNGETFFEYVSALRKLLVNCGFGKGQHSKLRNQLIQGCKKILKEKFNQNSMSLTQVFETGIQWDESRTFQPPPRPRNHRARKNRTPKCFRCNQGIREIHKEQPCPFEWAVCSSCSIKGHVSMACKYKDLTCNKCEKVGHIAKLCKMKDSTTTSK